MRGHPISVIGSLWRGPFAAPPISNPVTVGWVFLKILETIWKGGLLIFAVGAAIVGVILAWPILFPPPTATTTVSISYRPLNCTASFPFLVDVRNGRGDYLGKVELTLNAYDAKTGEELTGSSPIRRMITTVLPPRETTSWCIAGPNVYNPSGNKVTVSASVNYAAVLEKGVPIPRGIAERAAKWPKLLILAASAILVISVIPLAFAQAWGVLLLFDRAVGTSWLDKAIASGAESSGSWPLFVAGGLNVFVVSMLPYALEGTIIWEALDRIDQWSRSVGLADGAMFATFAVSCCWPWLVLWAWRPKTIEPNEGS